eukprot:1162107-Pelagomonas_calceolata.AAC.1
MRHAFVSPLLLGGRSCCEEGKQAAHGLGQLQAGITHRASFCTHGKQCMLSPMCAGFAHSIPQLGTDWSFSCVQTAIHGQHVIPGALIVA